jgi:hypothetical protein
MVVTRNIGSDEGRRSFNFRKKLVLCTPSDETAALGTARINLSRTSPEIQVAFCGNYDCGEMCNRRHTR